MIGKVTCKSEMGTSSKVVRRKCKKHNRIEKAELVFYPTLTPVLFFACGAVVDSPRRVCQTTKP